MVHYWQPVKCVNKDAPTNNSTGTVSLPDAGQIGSLLAVFQCDMDNVARTSKDWRLVDELDLLEVKGNGTRTILSLSARQARAFAWYDQKVFPPDVLREYATTSQVAVVLLNFGEKLYDPIHGLNAEKWTGGLELKVKNTLDTAQWNETKYSYEVFAMMKREGSPFVGHFRKEDYKPYTTAATTWEYINLPTEGKLRRLILEMIASTTLGVDDTNPTNYATQILYKKKSRKIELYDIAASTMQRINLLENEAEVLSHIQHYYHTADYGLRSGVGYPLAWAGMSVSKDGAVQAAFHGIDEQTNSCIKPEGYEADHPMSMLIKGMGPESTIIFRHDREPNMADMLDLKAEATVTFDIYAKNASGGNHILLDRYFTEEGGQV